MNETGNPKKTQGKVVVISGPSGVGKSTICREVIRRLDDVYLSVSVTTRARGPGEEDGRDYWFVSEPEFRRRMEEGALLEYAEVFGKFYGTPKDKVDEALGQGRIVILEIDVQGGRQAKAVYPNATMIFILPPTEEVLAERIGRRGRDNTDVAQLRLSGAKSEIAAASHDYSNMVINEDLEQAVDEVLHIIEKAPATESVSGGDGDVGDE